MTASVDAAPEAGRGLALLTATTPGAPEHAPGRKPVVFACAGCSCAAHLSWELAQEFDRRGAAEMSCLAGVGARKAVFLKKLRDRPVWVVDGCPIACGQSIFDLIGVPVNHYIQLADFGIRKVRPPEGGVDLEQLVAATAPRCTGAAPREKNRCRRSFVVDVSPFADMINISIQI